MKVAVLGAGVVGTAAAYFLAEDGHAVSVYDRRAEPAMETSFANGGQISACHAKPWATPDAPGMALRSLFDAESPIRLKPWRIDPALWSWSAHFLRNCSAARVPVNVERIARVSRYSRSVLKALRQRINLQYAQHDGLLHICRSADDFAATRAAAAAVAKLGIHQEELGVADCVKLEPALAHVAKIDLVGGVFSPDDESGDARRFSVELARHAAERGARFHTGATLRRLEASGRRVVRIITDQGDETPDAVVLALGSFSPAFVRPLGLKLPVYPAKGYSISVEITDLAAAPSISLLDDKSFMVFTRLGNVLRTAGTAELTGWDLTIDPVRIAPLKRNTMKLFPGAARYDALSPWCGLRPVTPDSVPILGRTPYENLFLDTGHGTLGWTMACGSGRVIADLVSSRTPEIDLAGLELARFGEA